MLKISVVIPTLWKSKRIHTLLRKLIDCNKIKEIILIDNNKKFFDYYEILSDKICLFRPSDNLYVNPSWNLGVEKARNKVVAILNDDIDFNTNVFDFINEEMLEKHGFIGMHKDNYKLEQDGQYQINCFEGSENFGWGCFIIFNKNIWKNIPEDLRVWYGDNYILFLSDSKISVLSNLKIETEMSETSGLEEFDEIKNKDFENYVCHEDLKIQMRAGIK